MCREKLPHAHFLFMNEQNAFSEVAETSAFPSFISDAFPVPETYAGRKKSSLFWIPKRRSPITVPVFSPKENVWILSFALCAAQASTGHRAAICPDIPPETLPVRTA